MYAFEYVRPTSLAAAVTALGAEGAVAIAGGQTLLPTLKQRLASPSSLVDIRRLEELRGVEVSGGALAIGAGMSHDAVARSDVVRSTIPAIAGLAAGIGDPQVRNLGTLGGSIANHDPAADWPAAVLGLGATVVTSAREIAADDFFTGLFETALADGELVVSVRFPIPATAAYRKFDQPASRFALTGAFVSRTAAGVRVAITGAGESGVFRHAGLEAALADSFAPDAVDGVAIAAGELLSDLHGTPEYRANLIRVMTRRAVDACD